MRMEICSGICSVIYRLEKNLSSQRISCPTTTDMLLAKDTTSMLFGVRM
jgi:hypothetical protein